MRGRGGPLGSGAEGRAETADRAIGDPGKEASGVPAMEVGLETPGPKAEGNPAAALESGDDPGTNGTNGMDRSRFEGSLDAGRDGR